MTSPRAFLLYFFAAVCGAIAQTPSPTAKPEPPSAVVASLKVAGTDADTLLSPEYLHTLPRQTVKLPASGKGPATTFEGVLVRDLLAAARVPLGRDLRGKAISWVVLFDAADGYQTVFSLAELDDLYSDHHVLLADTQDGKPLSADQGPLRLVIPEEERHTRWIHKVTQITVGPAQVDTRVTTAPDNPSLAPLPSKSP